MKIIDGLPTVHYEMTIAFDYIGEIGEFEPSEGRADAWEKILADVEELKTFFVLSRCIDSKRVLDMSAHLELLGEEPGERHVEPAYSTEKDELIGKRLS